jgi:UDP-N-acetyl-D-mannosaminuronic acid dehydrogenase
MDKPDICVIGLGYIGLPTASIFATQGFKVLGIDINPSVVDTVNGGNIHIEEPGLRTMVKAGVNSSQLRASTDIEPSDVYIIAVPTPCSDTDGGDRQSDLRAVEHAVDSILEVIEEGALVILESTSPPGTTADLVAAPLERAGMTVGEDVFVAHCPERVLPGHILRELTQNDRIIGGMTEACSARAEELYRSFVEGSIHLAGATEAELIKLMENTYRDVNIALANELADICDHLGVDAQRIIELANCHPRVHLHRPGPGVGGHCLPLDPWFVIESAPEQATLIKQARLLNHRVPELLVDDIVETLADVDDPRVAVFGIAYKGNVDDVRESPGLEVVERLEAQGVDVRIYDPHVRGISRELVGLEQSVAQADAIVITSAHDEFKYLDPAEFTAKVRQHWLFDFSNHLSAQKWIDAGFSYVGRGRFQRGRTRSDT